VWSLLSWAQFNKVYKVLIAIKVIECTHALRRESCVSLILVQGITV